MNLIHKHCGMRWPLFYFIFVRLVSGNIAVGYLITQLFLLLPTDTLNMVMFQTWRTYWIADIFVPSLIANHVVCYRARICLVGFLAFLFSGLVDGENEERDHHLLASACRIKFWFLHDNETREKDTQTIFGCFSFFFFLEETWWYSTFIFEIENQRVLSWLVFRGIPTCLTDWLCNTPPLTYTWQTTQKFAMNYKFVSWPHLTHNSVFLRLLSLPATVSRLCFFSFWVIFINNQHIHTQPKASPLCILTLSTTGNLRVGFSPIHMYPPPTSIDLVCVR
jgi:hypothetical protein